MQQRAQSKGGVCLSTIYANNHTKLLWRCHVGHEWWATPHPERAWCPACAKHIKLSERPEAPKELAQARGGTCLSAELSDCRAKLKWRCGQGHIWSDSYSNVMQGRWCSSCHWSVKACKPGMIEKMRALAIERGGQCLSDSYVHSKGQLMWQCRDRHVWKATPNSIRRGSWCPVCAGFGRTTLKDMQVLAADRGGLCLSRLYKGCQKNLSWKCKKGHRWLAMPLAVRHGSWCPHCCENSREIKCRRVFEQVFGTSFPKTRFSWLRSSKGRGMELDGYSESLKVGFEYQGVQHYEREFLRKPSSQRPVLTVEQFEWQQQRDREKRALCLEHGIQLIEVPWTTKNLLEFVTAQASALKAA